VHFQLNRSDSEITDRSQLGILLLYPKGYECRSTSSIEADGPAAEPLDIPGGRPTSERRLTRFNKAGGSPRSKPAYAQSGKRQCSELILSATTIHKNNTPPKPHKK